MLFYTEIIKQYLISSYSNIACQIKVKARSIMFHNKKCTIGRDTNHVVFQLCTCSCIMNSQYLNSIFFIPEQSSKQIRFSERRIFIEEHDKYGIVFKNPPPSTILLFSKQRKHTNTHWCIAEQHTNTSFVQQSQNHR